jgi:Asp-tRNA(Asn)/Glu-tRNA(Gln) amidotransferase A subunit family amidase
MELEKLRNVFFAYYDSLAIDALITPVAPHPVPRIVDDDLMNGCNYLMATNLLQMPSGVVPIRLSTENEGLNLRAYGDKYVPHNL